MDAALVGLHLLEAVLLEAAHGRRRRWFWGSGEKRFSKGVLGLELDLVGRWK